MLYQKRNAFPKTEGSKKPEPKIWNVIKTNKNTGVNPMKEKSVAAASLLNLFFAPIGSLYCRGWIGAIAVIILYIVAINADLGLLVWLAGPAWAIMGFFQCKAYNEKARR
jgi:hypothetical protein